MKIAAVQMDVKLGDVAGNVKRVQDFIRQTRAAGAELTIFPECALTGYCFENLAEALTVAEPVPGPATETILSTLRETGGYAIWGMLEASDDGVYNVAILAGSDGIIGHYRKIHLPHLGVDMFAHYGDRQFAVYDVADIRVGIGICYDSAFPESSRIMALQGADLIALPTNFPTGAQSMVEHVVNTRAMESNVYFAAVNRVGTERDFSFIGQSKIAGPIGENLAIASREQEEVLYADIDPQKARNKRIVRVPGKHLIDRFADRRPEMYGELTQPHELARPRDEFPVA